MADNVAVSEGSGKTVATDDVAGVQYQRVKVDLGGDGAASPLVRGQQTMANSIPVTIASNQDLLQNDALTDTQLRATAVPVSVSGGATSAKQDTAQTALDAIKTSSELIDDVVRAEDVASGDGHKGAVIMAVRQDTPADTSGTDGDYEIPKMSAGRMWTSAKVDTALPAGNNNIGDVDVASSALPTGAATSAKQDSLLTELQLKADLTETQPVSLASVPSHAVTNAGTFAVQAASAGDVAHDGVDSGNPIKTGGQARTTNPTAVADADRSNFITDKLGKQVVVGSIRDLKGVQQTTITSSTSETTVVTAVASTFLDVYGVIVTNTSATVTKVTFKDDTAGTTRFVLEVPATETRGFMLNESAAVPQAVVNKPWTATCGTSVASVEITMLYVKNL